MKDTWRVTVESPKGGDDLEFEVVTDWLEEGDGGLTSLIRNEIGAAFDLPPEYAVTLRSERGSDEAIGHISAEVDSEPLLAVRAEVVR